MNQEPNSFKRTQKQVSRVHSHEARSKLRKSRTPVTQYSGVPEYFENLDQRGSSATSVRSVLIDAFDHFADATNLMPNLSDFHRVVPASTKCLNNQSIHFDQVCY